MKTIKVVYAGITKGSSAAKCHKYISLTEDEKLSGESLIFGRKLHKSGAVGSIHEIENTEGTTYKYGKGLFQFVAREILIKLRSESEALEAEMDAEKELRALVKGDGITGLTLSEANIQYKKMGHQRRIAFLAVIIECVTKY